MKKDRVIVYKDSSSEPHLVFIYIEDFDFYFAHLSLDSIQSEIWQKSNSEERDRIILMSIERNKAIQTELITNHEKINEFIKSNDIIDKIRDYKLNQIIKK